MTDFVRTLRKQCIDLDSCAWRLNLWSEFIVNSDDMASIEIDNLIGIANVATEKVKSINELLAEIKDDLQVKEIIKTGNS